MIHFTLIIAALYGALAVGLGAFGRHALAPRQSEKMRAIWQTAERFHFYHALALLGIGALMNSGIAGAATAVAAWCLILGTLLFAGGLYLYSGLGRKVLNAITPVGGLLLIVGWIALLIGVWP